MLSAQISSGKQERLASIGSAGLFLSSSLSTSSHNFSFDEAFQFLTDESSKLNQNLDIFFALNESLRLSWLSTELEHERKVLIEKRLVKYISRSTFRTGSLVSTSDNQVHPLFHGFNTIGCDSRCNIQFTGDSVYPFLALLDCKDGIFNISEIEGRRGKHGLVSVSSDGVVGELLKAIDHTVSIL